MVVSIFGENGNLTYLFSVKVKNDHFLMFFCRAAPERYKSSRKRHFNQKC